MKRMTVSCRNSVPLCFVSHKPGQCNTFVFSNGSKRLSIRRFSALHKASGGIRTPRCPVLLGKDLATLGTAGTKPGFSRKPK
jgi:hypothetical protein